MFGSSVAFWLRYIREFGDDELFSQAHTGNVGMVAALDLELSPWLSRKLVEIGRDAVNSSDARVQIARFGSVSNHHHHSRPHTMFRNSKLLHAIRCMAT